MPDNYVARPANSYDTQKISTNEIRKIIAMPKPGAQEVISKVVEALEEKGYNPVNQLTGYILSGDPTYITSYKDARKIISRVERDELLEELISFYLFEPDDE